VGQNPPPGAVVDYYFKTAPAGEVTLEILDANGGLVRRYSSKEARKTQQPPEWPDLLVHENKLPAAAGMNRFVWDLRHEDPVQTPGAFYAGNPPTGPLALPGTYQVKLTAGARATTATFELKPDPRAKVSASDLEKQFALASKVVARLSELHKAVNQIRDLHAQLLVLKKRAGDTPEAAPVVVLAEAFERKSAPIEQELIQVKLTSSEGTLAFPTMLNEQLYYLAALIESADGAPSRPLYEAFDELSGRLDATLLRWRDLVSRDLPALDAATRKANLSWVAVGGG
jgi:hypothetical protein